MSPILGIIASSNFQRVTSSYESIATVTLTSAAANITFSSIPATYTHLQLRGRCSNAYGSGNSNVSVYANSDTTTTNYYSHYLYGNGTSAGASASANSLQTFQASGSSTYPSVFVLDLLDYANTNKYKTFRTLSGYDANGSGLVAFTSALWKNTAAVSSLQFVAQDGNWNSGTTFALYGIKGA